MVSEGEFWKKPRRMIQPAFHRDLVAGLYNVMRTVNFKLLAKWEKVAQQNEPVNATSDVSLMVLEVTLRPFFNILHDHPARNLGFAQMFADLRRIVAEVIERRRRDATEGTDIVGMLMEARDQSGQPMPDDHWSKR
jgi:cytochrome P450